MFKFLRSLFGSTDSVENEIVGGADAVFNAILEHADGGQRYVVTFGEPKLINRGGEYKDEYMTQIPTSTGVGDPEPPNIEYDLPGDEYESEDEDSDLFQLLDLYNIETVSDLGQLEGESVMATFENGVLSLRFDELTEGDE